MGGKGSGNKSSYEKFTDGCLLTTCTMWALVNWARFNDEQKMKITLAIAPKGFTEKHEIVAMYKEEQKEMGQLFQKFRKPLHNSQDNAIDVAQVTHVSR